MGQTSRWEALDYWGVGAQSWGLQMDVVQINRMLGMESALREKNWWCQIDAAQVERMLWMESALREKGLVASD